MNLSSNNHAEFFGISKHGALPGNPVWFVDFPVYDTFFITKDKPPVNELLAVTAETIIRSADIVNTPECVSYSGQMLEGCNLILELFIKFNVKYVSDAPNQNIHISYFDSRFKNVGIVLPSQHMQLPSKKLYDVRQLFEGKKLIIKPYLLDIYAVNFESRRIYFSSSVFIDIVPKI